MDPAQYWGQGGGYRETNVTSGIAKAWVGISQILLPTAATADLEDRERTRGGKALLCELRAGLCPHCQWNHVFKPETQLDLSQPSLRRGHRGYFLPCCPHPEKLVSRGYCAKPLLVRCQEEAQTTDWRATLKTIRNGVHKIDTYLNAALDLLGGEDGLCQYKCSDGSKPFPRYGYKPSPPNGCGSPLFGVHLNIGIPSLTKCCNQHDRCYETCGKSKNDCDEEFQYCLSKICRDIQKTLGLTQHVQACETTVELLFDSVIHLGCKPYLDSQRAACRCHYEEKTDL
ncbi:PREDICTED: group XIIA secretory phospholipase A2 [Colobus angolensis palliatus]|uniref:group XIIA secretory phospholipase A2 n=1 Tax=Colobus angolensis palliatus TaxID=336983 RepID=UPI0005F53A1F|nr:PREDICTED: group XIIA secretory phospholipase A2 [Colobus angolensis palliatus]